MSSVNVAVAAVSKATKGKGKGGKGSGKAAMFLPPEKSKFSDVVDIPDGMLLTAPAYFSDCPPGGGADSSLLYQQTRRRWLQKKYDGEIAKCDATIERLEAIPLEDRLAAAAKEKQLSGLEATTERLKNAEADLTAEDEARIAAQVAEMEAFLAARRAARAMQS